LLWAEKVLRVFADETREGNKGSFEVEGKMVDRPMIDKAIREVRLGVLLGLLGEEVREILKVCERLQPREDMRWEHDEK
jgi:hypothetical protein